MKRAIGLCTILVLSYFAVKSQEMGTIEVNENNTATLMFAAKIDFIVVGNNPKDGEGFLYYDIFQDGRVCVIRGNTEKAPETSITVKLLDETIFYGKLRFGSNTKIFYTFGEVGVKKESEEEKQQKIQESVVVKSEAVEEDRLNRLMKDRVEYSVFGSRESGLEFMITNIKNDANNTYLKIIINNTTGGDYVIDGILFKYIEGKRRGAKKNEAQIEERIMPKKVIGPEVVKAYVKTEIGIIMPLFSVGNSGDLLIQLREKNGTRNPKINIPGRDMQKVKIF